VKYAMINLSHRETRCKTLTWSSRRNSFSIRTAMVGGVRSMARNKYVVLGVHDLG
jgi:hypothetical protein